MSLEGEYDRDNIFAKILKGEMPCVKVHEDDATLVFMDVFPQSEGHCLVVPKDVMARNLADLPSDRVAGLFDRVQKTTRAVIAGLKPDGVRVAQFNGAPAGQTVYHLHVHVIPVWEGKTVRPHAEGGPVKADVLQPVAAKIAAAMEA